MKCWYWIAGLLTTALLFFLLGFYSGRNTIGALITDKPVPAQSVSVKSSQEDLRQESAQSDSSLLNINEASLSELMTLPGIGQTLAERIIAYRENVGLFITAEQITEVEGIGEKIYAQIQTRITVGRQK